MKTIYFHGDPNGNLQREQGVQGFDVDVTPNNYFVSNGGTIWIAFNASGGPSGAWGGLAPVPTTTTTNWMVPSSAAVYRVISTKLVSVSNQNIDLDSILSGLATPDAIVKFDPTLDDRMTEILNLIVQQFRGAIQVAGKYPLSVTTGSVPPETLKHVLNMAAFELVNSQETLQMVIMTDKGAYAPFQTFYREGQQYLEAITKGRGVTIPTDPTGRDYVNPINVPFVNPIPPFNPALPVNFNWCGTGPNPYGTYNPALPINVPSSCPFPPFNPAMPINKPIESIRIGASSPQTDMNTWQGYFGPSLHDEDFPISELGQP